MNIHLKHIYLLSFCIISIQSIAPSSNDLPSTFFKSTGYIKNIFSLPSSASLQTQPWSGSYWPNSNGGIGWRYSAQYQIYSQPYDHYSKYESSYFPSYVANNYSPSEKYDLLLGDYSYTLTRVVRSRIGTSATWEGKCHGWAPASFLEPRPTKPVTLYASDGYTPVTFYPDDIKALITQFYSESISNYRTDTMGSNCVSGKNSNGCKDTNPSSFYLAITNLIGIQKRAMLIDSSLNYQVWNYPVYKYSTKYYNVNTNYIGSIKQSLVSVDVALKSKVNNAKVSAKQSAKGTRYLLGVKMTAYYSNEIVPNRTTQGSGLISSNKVYNFILDLDKNYNIIGGSWVSSDHPDFIWKINESGIFRDRYDNVFSFFGTSSELRRMTQTARMLSSKGQVIYAVVKYLVNKSK